MNYVRAITVMFLTMVSNTAIADIAQFKYVPPKLVDSTQSDWVMIVAGMCISAAIVIFGVLLFRSRIKPAFQNTGSGEEIQQEMVRAKNPNKAIIAIVSCLFFAFVIWGLVSLIHWKYYAKPTMVTLPYTGTGGPPIDFEQKPQEESEESENIQHPNKSVPEANP